MLLTNQKTINYEIYINLKGNHPFHFASAKVVNKFSYLNEKQSLTQHVQNKVLFVGYFFT
jgi:hypothetical protein